MSIGDRIAAARKAAGFATAAEAAKALGLEAPAYRHYERGTRDPPPEVLTKLSRRYGRTTDYFLTGRDGRTVRRMVPVIGFVGAGSEAHFYANSDENLGDVEGPEDANENTRAAEIRGLSLGPLFEHWLIFFDDIRTPVTPDLYHRLCIVGLPNDKILIKQIKPTRTPNFFHLLSNNEEPMFDQEVIWAARVKEMRPK